LPPARLPTHRDRRRNATTSLSSLRGLRISPESARPFVEWSTQDLVETLSFVSRFELIRAHAG
jgi:hypothetical protein